MSRDQAQVVWSTLLEVSCGLRAGGVRARLTSRLVACDGYPAEYESLNAVSGNVFRPASFLSPRPYIRVA
jgi:hypothetical protein